MSGRPTARISWMPVLGMVLSLGACESAFAQSDPFTETFAIVGRSAHAPESEPSQIGSPVVRSEDAEYAEDGDVPTRAERHSRTSGGESQRTHFPTIGLDGFLQFDSVWFGENAATMAAFGNIADSTAVRRARVAVRGDIVPDVGYVLDFDFAASGHPSFRDMIVEFKELPRAERIVVGFFKTPFQLDVLTSSKDFTFAERAPFFTFAPFRQIGLGANGSMANERGTWSVAGFRDETDGFAVAQSDDGYGLAARSTVVPWYEAGGGRLLHLGGDYSHIQPSGQIVQYDSQLSFFVDEEPGGMTTSIPPLVDTGMIPADAVNLFNLELAGALGRLHCQGEITWALVNQIGGPPLTFYGGYAQLGWFVTRDLRPYDRRSGVFTTVQPRESVFDGGPGAWELAVRGTFLNLDDENIQGGRLNSAEFVVNWYLNEHVSLKFDCVRGFIDNPTVGEVELDICGARLQIIY